MNRQQNVNDLDLHDDLFRNEHIKAKSRIEFQSSIGDWKMNLCLEWNLSSFQFMNEARFIYPFEQPRPEC